ncbi:MAG: polyketide cyclase [Pseudomonadales bacterium]|nr:polyketide cyclase [Pseudomonadales bacterium]
MSDRSAAHAMFKIERLYAVTPDRVYQAWTDPKIKAQWFGPTDQRGELVIDYRVGGLEQFSGHAPNGSAFCYEAIFHEFVSDHRIVYSYTMDMGGSRISASLVTVEITASGDNAAQLLLTEQAVHLDGDDTSADREQGTRVMLEALATTLCPSDTNNS